MQVMFLKVYIIIKLFQVYVYRMIFMLKQVLQLSTDNNINATQYGRYVDYKCIHH